MADKIKNLFLKYREIILYLFFGGVTTLVNFLVYWPMLHWLHLPASISNIIAWIVAVLVAYITNKPFVFKSHDWSFQTVLPEFAKFIGCRVASGVFETLFLAVTVDFLSLHGLLMKVIVSVVVIILNYIGSKLLVFHQYKNKQGM